MADGAGAAAEAGETKAPVFSLHAVAGVAMVKTMQIRVGVGATSLIALLDTGSTHNFIGEEAARRSGLPIQPRPRLAATVANGDKVSCPGVLRHALLVIGDLSFANDLFVMPLAGGARDAVDGDPRAHDVGLHRGHCVVHAPGPPDLLDRSTAPGGGALRVHNSSASPR